MSTATEIPATDDDDAGSDDPEWSVPSDRFPEGYDDPWLSNDFPADTELYPLPIGLP